MNNREIKFRAWEHDRKVMYYGCQYNINDAEQNKYPLMQYTGLKDKNGVEIYEGDILKTDSTDKPLVVSWSNKFASFIIKRKDWAFKHYFGESTEPEWTEVIGNIYEHPDLLK